MSDKRFRAVWRELQESEGTDLAAAQELVRLLQRARGGGDPLGGMTVWALVYSHAYGTDVSVYQTEDDAMASAYKIVCDYWDETGIDTPIPRDPETAIEMYLEAREDESLEVRQSQIASTPYIV